MIKCVTRSWSDNKLVVFFDRDQRDICCHDFRRTATAKRSLKLDYKFKIKAWKNERVYCIYLKGRNWSWSVIFDRINDSSNWGDRTRLNPNLRRAKIDGWICSEHLAGGENSRKLVGKILFWQKTKYPQLLWFGFSFPRHFQATLPHFSWSFPLYNWWD